MKNEQIFKKLYIYIAIYELIAVDDRTPSDATPLAATGIQSAPAAASREETTTAPAETEENQPSLPDEPPLPSLAHIEEVGVSTVLDKKGLPIGRGIGKGGLKKFYKKPPSSKYGESAGPVIISSDEDKNKDLKAPDPDDPRDKDYVPHWRDIDDDDDDEDDDDEEEEEDDDEDDDDEEVDEDETEDKDDEEDDQEFNKDYKREEVEKNKKRQSRKRGRTESERGTIEDIESLEDTEHQPKYPKKIKPLTVTEVRKRVKEGYKMIKPTVNTSVGRMSRRELTVSHFCTTYTFDVSQKVYILYYTTLKLEKFSSPIVLRDAF